MFSEKAYRKAVGWRGYYGDKIYLWIDKIKFYLGFERKVFYIDIERDRTTLEGGEVKNKRGGI